MNEITIKTYEFLDILNESDLVKEIEKLKKKLLKNEELLNNINIVKETNDKELKVKLYENKDYLRYNELINKLNIILIDINHRLKKLINEKKCES